MTNGMRLAGRWVPYSSPFYQRTAESGVLKGEAGARQDKAGRGRSEGQQRRGKAVGGEASAGCCTLSGHWWGLTGLAAGHWGTGALGSSLLATAGRGRVCKQRKKLPGLSRRLL